MSATILKKKRGKAKAVITRAYAAALEVRDTTSYDELDARLTTLMSAWNQLNEIEEALYEYEDEAAENEAEVFAQYEEKFIQASSALKQAMRVRKGVPDTSEGNGTLLQGIQKLTEASATTNDAILQGLQRLIPKKHEVSLPKITIPPFAGDYCGWRSFRDLYIGSIGKKTDLSYTQKFYYLVSFLTGEAADLIKNIPITEDNFAEAWKKLEERYDRPHLIARSYIKDFMKLPTAATPNLKVMRKIIDGADECIRGLASIKMDSRDPWLIYMLLLKLDPETRQAWCSECGTRTDVTINMFLKFLDTRFIQLESTEFLAPNNKPQLVVRSHSVETDLTSCVVCKEPHTLSNCPSFHGMTEDDRRKFVAGNSLCFNCLRGGHRAKDCKSKFRCRSCNARHHTLVHKIQDTNKLSNNAVVAMSACVPLHEYDDSCSEDVLEDPSVVSNVASSAKQTVRTVMPTAIVYAKDKNGQSVKLRVLLDSGSEVSLLTKSCAQLLGTTRYSTRLGVKGIGSSNAGATKGCTQITLFSSINSSSVRVQAYILPRVTANVPARDIDFDAWNKLSSLTLADSTFNCSASIDVLLGADVVFALLRKGKIPIIEPYLVAINTIFGWVVSGQLAESTESATVTSYSTAIDDDNLISRLWELESCKPMPAESKHDDAAEIHFRNTHSRTSDGRYMVELPFKTANPEFGDTMSDALQRLRAMERKFKHNSEFKREYTKFIYEYLELGHMELIPPEQVNNGPRYYLPHHAILKPDSSTTKLRVVFDGSHKGSTGKSLNDELMIGPPIQRDLFGVALRFRQYSCVFTADITKMFRQIWVAPHHQDYQRIIWRDNAEGPVQHFRLRTVTYGTASAPFHSVRVLEQLAADNVQEQPHAAQIILNNVYVDDIMAGGSSVDEARELSNKLVKLLESGGFQLRKWYSNSSAFLEGIPPEDRERLIDTGTGQCIKALGLYWNPKSDSYLFNVNNSQKVTTITKRHLLSEMAKIFDIFGFLAPVVVKLKIMLQKVWQMKVDWDTPLSGSIVSDWGKVQNNLNQLKSISIPRQLFVITGTSEIHIFCDASTDAYADVIYNVKRNAEVSEVRLVAAKTRVAPLKAVSVPRLELCAALLGARLFNSIKVSLKMENVDVFAWTDSQLVIHYLAAPPRKWKTFVSNRCEEILDILPRTKWGHVKTSENPADCASRGVYPEELVHHKLWWNGPYWLTEAPQNWLTTGCFESEKISEDMLEVRSVKANPVVVSHQDSICLQLLQRHSSFNKVVRIVAYVLRASPQRRKESVLRVKHLTHTELYNARMKLYAAIQQDVFSKTIADLKQGSLSRRDPLLNLSPLLDSHGVLRVGGRLKDAPISFDAKHPVILPNCEFTANIVRELHVKYLHAGAAHLFFLLRQQFWILGARNLVRKIVHRCKSCFMQRKQSGSQLMADLPTVRIQPARAFLNSGCDFAGPITIKMTNCRKPRLCKAYICLFICLSTKAIHIELATDLTSEAFIAAFIRFTSRRGRCANLYSDNGTNFHGAHRILTEMHKMLLDEACTADIYKLLADDGTTWHFIPPSSPHFGGIWESNIKSIKLHMKRVIGDQLLSYDELYTVLTQIEAILNSRPLCVASDSDINPLTPGHFLVGDPLTAVPTPVEQPANCSQSSHFNMLRNMINGFWKRWHLEYLSTLQPRTKWTQQQRNFEIGDIAVLKEPNMPPSKWLLGKVVETHPGSDGLVRVVTVKTQHGSYKRPVTKLALLPCC